MGILVQSFFYVRNTSAQESEQPNTETDESETTTTESLVVNEGEVAGAEINTAIVVTPAPEAGTETPVPSQEIAVLPQTQTSTGAPVPPAVEQPQALRSTEEEIAEPENTTVSPMYVPPANIPKISVRPVERKIQIDPSADHSCRMENFTANMTSQNSLEKKIILTGSASTAKDIEVLGVPSGFKIKFKKNNQTKTSISAEQTTNILIEKMVTAQKGNFNVSFVYTEKGSKNSSIICQMNLINE